MKYYFVLLISIISIATSATNKKLRVMSFNITCGYFCEKKKFDSYTKRRHWIVDTIKRHKPNIIALQEVLMPAHLKWINKKLKNYELFYYRKNMLVQYADPAIFVRKDLLKITRYDGFWLGPGKGRFSFGYKISAPRRLLWVKLKFKEDLDKEFIFATAHFDNSMKNKKRFVKNVVGRFEKKKIPIIFAADTNLRVWQKEYDYFNKIFVNSFEITKKTSFEKNSNTDVHDSCNLEKGDYFPDCMVDHIQLSKKDKWEVVDWKVDQFKYGEDERFASDHRAIITDLVLD